MRNAENVNAPLLGGWVIGAAAGVVAFGVLVIVGKFDLFPAAAMGAVVAAAAGLVMGMPWGAGQAAPFGQTPVAKDEVPAAAQPVAVMAAPAATDGPMRLTAARDGRADDLKQIEGIGPAMEKLVNALGFYHFDQIAGWSDADVAWVDANMKTFKGRIVRDRWVAQAKIIVSEGLEAFRQRAKTNNY
jgi:predicted flap endonuclease-1-like 5' DNA nuclease